MITQRVASLFARHLLCQAYAVRIAGVMQARSSNQPIAEAAKQQQLAADSSAHWRACEVFTAQQQQPCAASTVVCRALDSRDYAAYCAVALTTAVQWYCLLMCQ